MRTVLFAFLQILVASGLLYAYYHFFLRNKRFHQYNRFYLLGSVLISLLIPLINIPIYFSPAEKEASVLLQTLSVMSLPEENGTTTILATRGSTATFFTTANILYYTYLLICLVALFRVIVSIVRVWKLTRRYPVEKLDHILFVNTNEPGTPFSFFRWLFWNQDIDPGSSRGDQVFRHELYHIHQKHSIDILFMEIATIFFWINPFFHLVKKELKAIHEFLADQYAANEHQKWDYAELLLMQVLKTKHSLVHPFFHNQIKRRIAMITSSQQPGHQYFRKIMVLPLVAVLAGLFAFTYKAKHETPVTEKAAETFTIVLDAGHGGSDQGVVSPDGKYQEAAITLELAKTIERLAPGYNVKVVMTRNNEQFPGNASNKDDGLKNRLSMANQFNPDAFISLHVGVVGKIGTYQETHSGIEAFIASKTSNKSDVQLASSVVKELSAVYATNTVMKQRNESIYVLDRNEYPAVLLECGYINNKQDMQFLAASDNQERIAKAILLAITRFANKKTSSLSVMEQPVNDTPRLISPVRFQAGKLTVKESKPTGKSTEPGIYIVNDKKYSREEMKTAFPNAEIVAEEMIVTPAGDADAINKYGDLAKEGVIEFKNAHTTPAKPVVSRIELDKFKLSATNKPPLYVLDGEPVVGMTLEELKLDPNSIDHVRVLKDQSAIDKYGPQAADGVIEIITKTGKAAQMIVEGKNKPELTEVAVTGYKTTPDAKEVTVQGYPTKKATAIKAKEQLEVKEVTVTGYKTTPDVSALKEVTVQGYPTKKTITPVSKEKSEVKEVTVTGYKTKADAPTEVVVEGYPVPSTKKELKEKPVKN